MLRVARELFPPTPSDDIPPLVHRMLEVYLERRVSPDEGFATFTNRHEIDALRQMFSHIPATENA